jgi:hypothetical protein
VNSINILLIIVLPSNFRDESKKIWRGEIPFGEQLPDAELHVSPREPSAIIDVHGASTVKTAEPFDLRNVWITPVEANDNTNR